MDHNSRPRFVSPPRSGSSRSVDRSHDKQRTHRPSLSPTWAGKIGSMHMTRQENVLNASAGGAPIVTMTFNNSNENTSVPNSRQDSEVIVEPVIPARADHEVYYHQLLTQKKGSPLWVPGPGMQLPVEYRRQGISIGDVGIITSGGEFDFLFNIFEPVDSPINIGFIPQTFFPLPREEFARDIQPSHHYGQHSYVASPFVRKAGSPFNLIDQRFESTSREAAILTMPEGASTQNLFNTGKIIEYVSKNAQDWYDYARQKRGRNVKNGDIRVVVGTDKVKSWGIAISRCNNGQTAFLTFRRENQPHLYRWECTGGSGKVGPAKAEIDAPSQNDMGLENQCVFVRTINFTISGEIRDDLATEAVHPVSAEGKGRDSVQDNRRGRRTSGGRGAPSSRQTRSIQGFSCPVASVTLDHTEHGVGSHPSAALHIYLHQKFPNAKTVVTQDSNWISVLKDDDAFFPQPEELVERILHSFEVRETDGVVTMRMKPDMVNPQDSVQIVVQGTTGIYELSRIHAETYQSVSPWCGWIETTGDALLIFEAARRHLIPHFTHRLVDSERRMITSGSVFVFYDDRRNIGTRWTDGYSWTFSGILGNFRLYREKNTLGAGHRTSRTDQDIPDDALIEPTSQPKSTNAASMPRSLVGSKKSRRFKPGGLAKKTFSLSVGSVAWHLISYYKIRDVESGRLRPPSSLPEFASLDISPVYLDKTHFRNPPKIEIDIDGIPRYRGEADDLDVSPTAATAIAGPVPVPNKLLTEGRVTDGSLKKRKPRYDSYAQPQAGRPCPR